MKRIARRKEDKQNGWKGSGGGGIERWWLGNGSDYKIANPMKIKNKKTKT